MIITIEKLELTNKEIKDLTRLARTCDQNPALGKQQLENFLVLFQNQKAMNFAPWLRNLF